MAKNQGFNYHLALFICLIVAGSPLISLFFSTCEFSETNLTIEHIPFLSPYYLDNNRNNGGNDTEAPIANASLNRTVDQYTMVTFDGSSSADDIGIKNYTWTFLYDKEIVTLYGISPNFTFNNASVYIVTLNVTDAVENWAIDTMVVTVKDIEDPVANAGVDLFVKQGTVVTFNGSGSSDNVGIVNYTWRFIDDGWKTLHGESPTYRFRDYDTFTVTLNVTDAEGNWNIESTTVVIYDDIKEPEVILIYVKETEIMAIYYENISQKNKEEIPLDANPILVFNETIDPETIEGNISVFEVVGENKLKRNFTWVLSEGNTVLPLIPKYKLGEGEIYSIITLVLEHEMMKDQTYVIEITGDILDMAGKKLHNPDEYTFKTIVSFQMPRFDPPPKPQGGDTVEIIIMFGKDVDETTVTPENIKVTNSQGEVPIYLHFGKNEDSTENKGKVIVTLASPLEYGETYFVNVSGNIKDKSGSELGSSYDSSFKTSDRSTGETDSLYFFIFLLVVLAAVVIFAIFVMIERTRLKKSKVYSKSLEQLDSRKKLIRQFKLEEREREKEKKKADKDREESSKGKEIISPIRRSTDPRPGKVRYYRPDEITSFEGTTYDVKGFPKTRKGADRSIPRSTRHQRSRDEEGRGRRDVRARKRRGGRGFGARDRGGKRHSYGENEDVDWS